ncbi:MAG: class I SAM-dependent methyltransferase [Elusimicrobia bacterium]|nr:class I SAM-dependent methyltransferase [Elusimicrobiota bacterium]
MIEQDKVKEREYHDWEVTQKPEISEEDLERVKNIIEYCDILHKGNFNILEVGCGKGSFGKLISNYGNNVTGIDLSTKTIEVAKKMESEHYKVSVGDIDDIKLFKNNTFEIILCPFVLHHIPDISNAIHNFSYWVSSKGKLIIIEPNGSNITWKISNFVGHNLRKITGWHLNGTINEKIHNMKYYRTELAKKGFSIKKIKYILDVRQGSDNILINILFGIRYILAYILWNTMPEGYGGQQVIIYAEKN